MQLAVRFSYLSCLPPISLFNSSFLILSWLDFPSLTKYEYTQGPDRAKGDEIHWPGLSEKVAYKTAAPIKADGGIDKEVAIHEAPLAATPNPRRERSWPVIACGNVLFSDGHVNGVIGSVNTMLCVIYGKQYTKSRAHSNVSAIAFAGAVVGLFFLGYTNDY